MRRHRARQPSGRGAHRPGGDSPDSCRDTPSVCGGTLGSPDTTGRDIRSRRAATRRPGHARTDTGTNSHSGCTD